MGFPLIQRQPDQSFGKGKRMHFRIEMGPYQRLAARDHEDSTVSEAIETLYQGGPDVRIHWAPGTWVELPVAGGISDIYLPIVQMLKEIDRGAYPFDVSFLCSCFTAIWSFSELDGVLTIMTRWTVVIGAFNGRETRDAHLNDVVTQFTVEKNGFVAEWWKMLTQIKRDLLSAGYGAYLGDFERLPADTSPDDESKPVPG